MGAWWSGDSCNDALQTEHEEQIRQLLREAEEIQQLRQLRENQAVQRREEERQRARDLEMRTCAECGWVFASKPGRKSHEQTVHVMPAERQLPEAPVSSSGNWVLARDFEGKKSFGFFVCRGTREHRCRATWVSAHALPDWRQACKTCGSWLRPALMWANDAKRRTSNSNSRDLESGPPHRHDLCERCMKGHHCTLSEGEL